LTIKWRLKLAKESCFPDYKTLLGLLDSANCSDFAIAKDISDSTAKALLEYSWLCSNDSALIGGF